MLGVLVMEKYGFFVNTKKDIIECVVMGIVGWIAIITMLVIATHWDNELAVKYGASRKCVVEQKTE